MGSEHHAVETAQMQLQRRATSVRPTEEALESICQPSPFLSQPNCPQTKAVRYADTAAAFLGITHGPSSESEGGQDSRLPSDSRIEEEGLEV